MQDPSIFVGEGLPVAFSSISFLFYFLPLFFIIYYLIPARAKNVVLLVGSLFFYAWGEPRWILLLLASILVTWLLGRARSVSPKRPLSAWICPMTGSIWPVRSWRASSSRSSG